MQRDPITPEEMRPIAIHVESIFFEPNLKHTERRRVAVIDLEFSAPHAEQLIKNLQDRLAEERVQGSIRIRFKGRMVLE
jgi:hypothetical protein